MPQTSAGILLYRHDGNMLSVLLTHPGGPFWRHRDDGAWTIPKGLPAKDETAAEAARREFGEELGVAPEGELLPLARIRQRGGKWVEAFALEGDYDTTRLRSNTFTMEWPPRSGRMTEFPEVDRAEWFAIDLARSKILASQLPLLEALEQLLAPGGNGAAVGSDSARALER